LTASCAPSAASGKRTLGFAAGLHHNYVRAIDRSEINPNLRVFCKLAYRLRMPASDLLVMAERLAAARSTRVTRGQVST